MQDWATIEEYSQEIHQKSPSDSFSWVDTVSSSPCSDSLEICKGSMTLEKKVDRWMEEYNQREEELKKSLDKTSSLLSNMENKLEMWQKTMQETLEQQNALIEKIQVVEKENKDSQKTLKVMLEILNRMSIGDGITESRKKNMKIRMRVPFPFEKDK